MDQETLRLLLAQLHRELAANPPTDDRSRQLLVTLQQDIARAVAPAPDDHRADTPPAGAVHDWRGRVQEAMASFEGAHPQASGALERVMTLLSNFGL